MRTTVKIDDTLLVEVKTFAAASGKTLNEVVEDALRESIARRRETGNRARATIRTLPGGELRPGVELDDSSQLLDLMTGAEP